MLMVDKMMKSLCFEGEKLVISWLIPSSSSPLVAASRSMNCGSKVSGLVRDFFFLGGGPESESFSLSHLLIC